MRNKADADLFDDLVANELGHYVYALFDPTTGQPFYVGKGGGRAGRGNRRIFDHFEEARKDEGSEREKIAKIQQIWETSGDVPWKIVRSGLQNEDEALIVEGALIDMLREMSVPLSNKQSGHGSAESGMKSRAELRALCAPKFDLPTLPPSLMKRPIFIFNISKGVAARRSKHPNDGPDLYTEATCQFWNVSEKYRALEGAIAIGCINGISRAVVLIDRWRQESERRWEIVPKNSLDMTQDLSALIYKNLSVVVDHCKGFWLHGNFLVMRIDDNANIKVLRGSPDRTIPLPPQPS